jgi:hypothetical protein
MPVSTSELPEEMQWAFLVFSHLPDRWEGMSGSYLGKDWSSINFFLDLFEIEDKKTLVFFLANIESKYVKQMADKMNQQRKQQERQANAGKYAHNVSV